MTPRRDTSSTYTRRVTGDAVQLVGIVREFGADAIGRLLDAWGPDHVRAVCIALAQAVEIDRSPRELWGWLGPVDNRMTHTISTVDLFQSLRHDDDLPTVRDERAAPPRRDISDETRAKYRANGVRNFAVDADRAALLAVACPACPAGVGEQCLSQSGRRIYKTRQWHAARRLAKEAAA